jgi:hypothetical protein
MLNPFNDDTHDTSKDTDKFIVSIDIKQKIPIYSYIIIGLINILEILTTILGGTNDEDNTGLFHSKLTLQNWLFVSGIYSMIYMVIIYQFNLKIYTNKIYFIIMDFIKFCWVFIGGGILFGFNTIIGCNFIIAYSLFYFLFSSLYFIYSIYKTSQLKQLVQYY